MQSITANVRCESDHRVVIVGAGASGIGAARTLITSGIRPIILEANSRIGGRLYMHKLTKNLLNSTLDEKNDAEVVIQLGILR